MNRDQFTEDTPKPNIEPDAPKDEAPAVFPGFTVSFMSRPIINIDNVVTQILENALSDLDGLRRELERTTSKHVLDVRDFRRVDVLQGVEEDIRYEDLLDIISEMKNGIALRRVALLERRA